MKKYRLSPEKQIFMEQSAIPFAIYQYIDKRVVPILLSAGFFELFGYRDIEETYELMGKDLYHSTHPDDIARIADAFIRFETEDEEYNITYRAKVGDEYRQVHAIGRHIYPDDGARLAVIWFMDEGVYVDNDVNENTDSLAYNISMALKNLGAYRKTRYDFLTGIPNMTYFFELTKINRENTLAAGGRCAIGFASINGMKYYNKKYGFAEGDKILRKFANLLVNHFGNEQSCRIGQDNYAFFANEDTVEDEIKAIIKEFKEITEGRRLYFRVGIYSSSMGVVDTSLACDRAKYACDTLRNSNESGYVFFNESMLAFENQRQYIVDNVDKAIQERWIKAYYQPIVRTASGKVCDEEALARWVDPERGIMSPADFIPILEDANLIYKVDLHILDEIIERFKMQKKDNLFIVPISINLSRTDFECCDIVKEICDRLDAADIEHELITIEITESVVGNDFDFIKKQVERFRSLGFRVWMDDFGSGYSSLDVLQDIHFDLIKLDMRFMKQFYNDDKSKIIITELVKMAIGLGVETVCEGVEQADQVEFLKEVGCTKLQGYYYSKPVPYEEILERNRKGIQIGFENPEESDYFGAVGKINLYDMGSIANEDENIKEEASKEEDSKNPDSLGQYFNTVPMAVIEVYDDKTRVLRCNRSYREFVKKAFNAVNVGEFVVYKDFTKGKGSVFFKVIKNCLGDVDKTFIDEKINSDTTIHALIKKIAMNPVTGVAACAVVVLGVLKDAESVVTYADIANSLSSDYMNLYYVNIETEEFTEYAPDSTGGDINMERHGTDFFMNSRKDAEIVIYKDDLEGMLASFTKENVMAQIEKTGVYSISYRLLVDGEPIYANMKAVRMTNDDSHIIIGVNNVDSQVRQKMAMDRLQEERIAFSRITALAGEYLCFYMVDPETDEYIEYNAQGGYENLQLDKNGQNFFDRARKEGRRVIYHEDIPNFEEMFTKEKIMNTIRENGIFMLYYRLIIGDELKYVSLRAAMVKEKEGSRIIVGINNIDAQIRRDMEYNKVLEERKLKLSDE